MLSFFFYPLPIHKIYLKEGHLFKSDSFNLDIFVPHILHICAKLLFTFFIAFVYTPHLLPADISVIQCNTREQSIVFFFDKQKIILKYGNEYNSKIYLDQLHLVYNNSFQKIGRWERWSVWGSVWGRE